MSQHLSRVELLEKIQEASLASVDLTLFLDTHPDCKEALRDLNQINQYYRELVDEYQAFYGPLVGFGLMNDMETGYTWSKGPFPWERQNERGNF